MTKDPRDAGTRARGAERPAPLWPRTPANTNAPPGIERTGGASRIHAELRLDPARDWAAAAEKARFLIEWLSMSQDAQNPSIQKLIRRAMGDFARLLKREQERP